MIMVAAAARHESFQKNLAQDVSRRGSWEA
jgi:hypothetical protein